MAKRIPWEEQEALLLLEVYDLIQKNPEKKKELSEALSINLRRRANDNKLVIDDKFRNQAGINMRLLEIEKILHPDHNKFGNTSELFIRITDLYSNHRRTFLKKLTEVERYRVKNLTDVVSFNLSEAIILLDAFLNMRTPGETQAHTARVVSAKLRSLAKNTGCVFNDGYRSEGGINGRLRKMSIAFSGDNPYNEPVPQIFHEAVSLYKSGHKDYIRILSETESVIGTIVLPEDLERLKREKQKRRDASPLKKTKYINTKKDRKLSDLYGKSYVAVFETLEKRFYTRPKGVSATDIFSDLKKRVLRKDIITILESASWARKTSDGKYIHASGASIMDANAANEKDFFSWAQQRISSKQYELLRIKSSSISMLLFQHKAIKKPLFLVSDSNSISRVIPKVSEYIGNKKLRSTSVLLLKLYEEYLKSKKPPKIVPPRNTDNKDGVLPDASQTEFYNWLSQHELLAGPTCRSYVSGIRSAENYAQAHGFSPNKLFTDEKDTAIQTACNLLEDPQFVSVHASYQTYLKRFLQFLGYQEAEKGHAEEKKEQTAASVNQKSDLKLVQAIEDVVRSYIGGITKNELGDRFRKYSDRQIRAAIQTADIIPVLGKYYHRDQIEDFDSMADTLLDILLRQFNQFGDYTSDAQLYKEAQIKLDDFFFFNGAFNSRAEVYDLAAYLFEKRSYKGKTFVFRDKRHIWKQIPDYPMDFGGLLIKYGRDHGNTFSREEAIDFFKFHGSATPAQTLSLILNRSGRDTFFQYAENRFVLTEALRIDSTFLAHLASQIEALLEGDDYVALGDVSEYFYSTLPALPVGVTWGPLLLEAVLARYDIGFITIDAGETNDLKTIDAALVRKDSPFVSFADIVWNELNNDFALPKIMTNEEFRQYLLNKGFIRGAEKTYTVHKTVANDLRFFWSDSFSHVTIGK